MYAVWGVIRESKKRGEDRDRHQFCDVPQLRKRRAELLSWVSAPAPLSLQQPQGSDRRPSTVDRQLPPSLVLLAILETKGVLVDVVAQLHTVVIWKARP